MNSKRASLFSEILPYINSEDWERRDGFIVFGLDGFYREVLGDEAELSSMDVPLRVFANRVKVLQGQRELAGRISMVRATDSAFIVPLQEFFKSLSEQEREDIVRSIKDSQKQSDSDAADSGSAAGGSEDVVDAALAERFVTDLDAAYTRSMSLDKLDVSTPSYNTSAYFEEAHRCDLYGQKIAAAVLCRALVEDYLKKLLDSDGHLRTMVRETEESYFEALLERAEERGLLDHSRVECAKEIRVAGNKAVHDLSAFKTRYQSRVSELVDGMRQILEDLSLGTSPNGR